MKIMLFLFAVLFFTSSIVHGEGQMLAPNDILKGQVKMGVQVTAENFDQLDTKEIESDMRKELGACGVTIQDGKVDPGVSILLMKIDGFSYYTGSETVTVFMARLELGGALPVSANVHSDYLLVSTWEAGYQGVCPRGMADEVPALLKKNLMSQFITAYMSVNKK